MITKAAYDVLGGGMLGELAPGNGKFLELAGAPGHKGGPGRLSAGLTVTDTQII